MKYVTRTCILLAIFVGAVWFMGKNMKEDKFTLTSTVEVEESQFPTIVMNTDGTQMNVLYGYTGTLDASNFRESITPVMSDGVVELQINENGVVVRKVNYELTKVGSKDVIASGSVSALDTTDTGKSTQIRLNTTLESDVEYVLQITLTTDASRKIQYFTRIKQLATNYVTEQLEFIQAFHEATFDEAKMEEYTSYLERTVSSSPRAVTHVNITSPLEQILWGNLNPTIVSSVIPTIKEAQGDWVGVELRYLVKGTMKDSEGNVLSEENIYTVKEYYRVVYRYNRMFLMEFERTMDEVYDFTTFDPTKIDGSAPAITLGFVEESLQLESSGDSSKVAFVDQGTLWYYDINENEASKVYSFMDSETTLYHGGYYQNDIRILDLYDNGNMNFLVYGYFNHGDYEGRLGFVLYKYIAESNRIEEELFVPLDVPFELIEENLDGFYYLSNVDTFYFSMNNTLYFYSLVKRQVEVIAENVTNSSFLLSEEGKFLAWQNDSNPMNSNKIHVLKLETEEQFEIEAPSGQSVILLEASNSNLVYGYAKTKDIVIEEDGTTVTPMELVEIADADGEVIKSYVPDSGYVSDVKQIGSRLEITLVRKSDGGKSYSASGTDFIVNRIDDTETKIQSYTVEVETDLNRWYISLPSGYSAKRSPKIQTTVNTIITEDTTLHIQESETTENTYYVYAKGKLIGSYAHASDAILMAEENAGTVLSNSNHLIWVTDNTSRRRTNATITPIYTSQGVSSTGACASMLLRYNSISMSAETISSSNQTMYEVINEKLDNQGINLTGCSLSQVLYMVGTGRPVIGMKDRNNAVLIIGYDETSVTYIDPAANTTTTVSTSRATTMFEEAGNVFVGYVN